MSKRKHWSERKPVELISLKEGVNFYMPDAVSLMPYRVLKQPTNNGIMVYCETPGGNRQYYYGDTQVVKEKLTDINPDI